MADAPVPSTSTQVKKTSTSSKGGKGEEKKRFEVKKVGLSYGCMSCSSTVVTIVVERGSPLGLGHHRRQLRHLP